MSEFIKITNCSKKYGENLVLKNVNLSIQKGEFITLLGGSGSGKTTLLNIIGGFSDFDEGSIEIGGTSYKKYVSKSKDRIKIFQDYALMPWLNIMDNVAFALQCKNVKKQEARNIAIKYLALVGLKGKEYSFPSELSGGQNQRVALARALSVEPKILLLDEPFSALDNFTRNNLQVELKQRVKQSLSTSIFVTHDIEESIFLGERIIILKYGEIVADIKVDIELHDRDSGEFVALKKKVAWHLAHNDLGINV